MTRGPVGSWGSHDESELWFMYSDFIQEKRFRGLFLLFDRPWKALWPMLLQGTESPLRSPN